MDINELKLGDTVEYRAIGSEYKIAKITDFDDHNDSPIALFDNGSWAYVSEIIRVIRK